MLDKRNLGIEMTPLTNVEGEVGGEAKKKNTNELIPGKAWLGYMY